MSDSVARTLWSGDRTLARGSALQVVLSILLTAPLLAQPVTPREAMKAAIEKQRAAAEVQRQAVRKQAELSGPWPLSSQITSELQEPTLPPCDPIADTIVAPLIESAAKTNAVSTKLLRAVIEQESGYHACAVSAKGAQGLMQLMPQTADQLGVHDVFDPRDNIEAGAKYLKQLVDKYKGDLSLALGAYNAGPTLVDQSGGIPDIPETRDYVDAILKKLK
jgi:soluble lytic murein transglycosylase-like protein